MRLAVKFKAPVFMGLGGASGLPSLLLRLGVLSTLAGVAAFGLCTYTISAPYLSAGAVDVDATAQTLTVQITTNPQS